ncbi:MAG: ChrR family anti-sigma-E factor [Alphaproteobacteria bacterium]
MTQNVLRADLAAAYAAGALDAAMRLLVETQVGVLARAASIVGISESISGAMLEAETPSPLRADALERALAKIANEPPEAVAMRAVSERNAALMAEISALPAVLQDAAIRTLARRKWQRPTFGLRVLELDVESEGKVELIRIEPGLAIPKHTHEGPEYTLVLTGAFSDENGRYGVGDVSFADPDVKHRPRAERGEVCWNLAVIYGELKWSGALGLVQKLLN